MHESHATPPAIVASASSASQGEKRAREGDSDEVRQQSYLLCVYDKHPHFCLSVFTSGGYCVVLQAMDADAQFADNDASDSKRLVQQPSIYGSIHCNARSFCSAT